MNGNNLWGELPKPEKVRTPIAILREQASLLSDLTNRLLEGEVKPFAQSPNRVQAGLYIVAPPLGNYRVEILKISHGLTLYPVDVTNARDGSARSCNTEAEYAERLTEIFQSEHVRKILSSLLVQIESAK